MGKHTLLCFSLCLFLFSLLSEIRGVQGTSPVECRKEPRRYRPTKLFVFGDSYSDTGNNRKTENSWKVPYGITFPGKPAGRFSDGRVLTDYIARYLRGRSPVPYRLRKHATNRFRCGMNFAYGGTGVFDTMVPDPNMTTQIDFLENLVKEKVYTKHDLRASMALLTNAGNDYTNIIARGGSRYEAFNFIGNVTHKLGDNMERIHALGVKKVAVVGIQPIGCLPRTTVDFSFKKCDSFINSVARVHNNFIKSTLKDMIKKTPGSPFVYLDLYDAFMTVLENKGDKPGIPKFPTPLKPCCMGINNDTYCGSVDENGTKQYTVCENPRQAFFWDMVHPTQAGWHAAFLALKSNLTQIEEI